LKGYPWPAGTEDFVNVRVKGDYIQRYSKHFNVEPLIKYNTRVENLEKAGSKWKLQSSILIKGAARGTEIKKVVEVMFALDSSRIY
jgi:hypothetical protein